MELILAPNILLHTKSFAINKRLDDKDLIKAQLKEMIVIQNQKNGIGLAAIQVGLLKAMFVMGSESCINPEVIKRDPNSMEQMHEGCLSFPNKRVTIKRSTRIEVGYYNIKFEMIVKNLSGMDAVVFQHELDHLNGLTMYDRQKRQRKK